MCRQLKDLGQKIGAAAALVHISRRDKHTASGQPGKGKRDSLGRGEWVVRVANVGDTEVVLCRHGRALALTRRFDVGADAEECQRVVTSGGIVTEVCGLELFILFIFFYFFYFLKS